MTFEKKGSKLRLKKPLNIAVPKKQFEKLSVDQLATGLKDNSKDWLLVDVREEDFIGGNMPGVIHIPFGKFSSSVEDILVQIQDSGVTNIAIFSMYAQQRGPACASLLADKLGSEDMDLKMYLVIGGFNQWLAKYKNSEHLVENYKKEYWDEEGLHAKDSKLIGQLIESTKEDDE